MLRALLERGLQPDLVLGTSVGALNGALVAEHLGGHLPFEAEATGALAWDRPNTISVAVENKQLLGRVPPGPGPAGPGQPAATEGCRSSSTVRPTPRTPSPSERYAAASFATGASSPAP